MQQYSSESQRLSTQFLPAGTVASSEARLMTRDFCHERTAELYSPESESLLRLPEGATATIHYTVNLSLTFIAFLSFIYFLCSIQTTTKTILYVRNRSCLRRRTYSLRLFYVIRWLAFFGLLISLLCLGTSWLGYELNRYDLVMGMS